ncbi:hypothetical protein N665_0156s0028 [Sinapis alba]|nr:hypothetical protein N665_0156s0028 [Sinapis alba]
MELELPKRLYAEGLEPQVKKINNCCRIELMRILKEAMSAEFDDVKTDPVFKHIIAIAENKLKFSEKLVHSFLCKQLIVSKMHEKWFVFARTPLRFSLQEYHAVTGLKISRESSSEVVKWKRDGGFWSDLLRKGGKITLQSIKKVHLKEVHNWTRVDRMRLIYLCVIMGVVMGRDEKVNIPPMYIKLVMDLDKLQNFHWGLHSYDFLMSSIEKVRKKLGKKDSYIFEGFSYAFQIWIMEAILDFGEMCGRKVSDNFRGPRKDEMEDERVNFFLDRLKNKFDWSNTEWPVLEPEETVIDDADNHDRGSESDNSMDDTDVVADDGTTSVKVAGKGKIIFFDEGAETRKKKLLCNRMG